MMYYYCSLNQVAGYPSFLTINVCIFLNVYFPLVFPSWVYWRSLNCGCSSIRTNLLLLLRPTCGTTTKRWWPGWRGSWPKRRAPGPSSTRTLSTSAEITSSSRSAGNFSQHSVAEPSSLSAQDTRHTEIFFYILFLSAFFLTAASSRPIRRSPWIP